MNDVTNNVFMTLNLYTYQWKFPSVFDADDYINLPISRDNKRVINPQN